jgi:hypothetical protein
MHTDPPSAVVIVDRKGKIVATNIEAVLEWRKKHEPVVYRKAINDLARVFAEVAVDRFIAEQVEQQRIAGGFAYFARHRLEHGLVP